MDSHEVTWDPGLARALIEAHDVGGAIRLARQVRGWRQADLGRACGYSASTISRLETGRRTGAHIGVLRQVAEAAGIPPGVLGVLLGLPSTSPDTVAGAVRRWAEEDDPMRRRGLLSAAGLTIPAALLARVDEALAVMPAATGPSGSAALTARLARAQALFDGGDLARLVAGLPGLLAVAHEAGEGGPDGYVLLAACYDMATEALNKVGRYQASRITADRARMYAGLSGSPVAMATAARSLGIVLRHEGRYELAERVTLDGAGLLERTGLSRPAESAAYAQMLCTCAYNCAQAGDRGGALELMRDAERAVTLVPPGSGRYQGYLAALTPAQVRLYRVGVHWALGDAGAAVRVGKGLHPAQFPTPERRSRLHTDMARAWWQWEKPEQTTLALLAACRQTPAEVRERPAIRRIAAELAKRHPRVRGVPELTRLAGLARRP